MLLKMIEFLFSKLIADLPKEKREECWQGFLMLIGHVAESGSKGVTEAMLNEFRRKYNYDPNAGIS